jgi:drug/metabolite transporter (DMT)-like permease
VRYGSLARLSALALLWGSSFLWIKIALRGLSPVQITLARLALGAAVLVAILYARRLRLPSGGHLWVHLTVAALFANAIPYTLFGIGEQHVDSNLAGILNATTPLWTLLIGLLVRHERRLSATRLGGLLLGFAGTLLIFSPWEAASGVHVAGALACLGASASYGISYVYMDRFLAGRAISSLALSACQLTAATGLLLAATPFAGAQAVHLSGEVLASILVLGVLGTGAAYILNYRLIIDDGSTIASTVTYLIPVVSIALGTAVLGETISAQVVAGVAVVLAGVALARHRPPQAANTRNEERRKK